MMVAVALVGMMQVASDDVVGVVAVGDGLVTTARAVDMAGLVGFTRVAVTAVRGVGRVDRERVLVDVVAMHVVQVAVVEVVGVAIVPNGGVAASGAVDVVVGGVGMAGHGDSFLRRGDLVGGVSDPWDVLATSVCSAWASALSMSSRTWVSASR